MDVEKMILEILDKVSDLKSDTAGIMAKLDDYPDYKDKTDRALNVSEQNQKDIKELKDNNKWMWRSIIGGFITLIFAIILAKVFHVGG